MSLLKNIEFLRGLPQLGQIDARGRQAPHARPGSKRLLEQQDFGSNPGALRMFSYVPPGLGEGAALVVALHGCTQTAESFDTGAGWSMLAERYGFVLLMPQQVTANNPNGCFNWFQPEDIRRDSGEALSIRQMVQHLARSQGVDEARVMITGLSAGGAMTSAMLAVYPEVFSAGAIIAGLPFGVAANLREALSGMYQTPVRSSRDLGDLVRGASLHRGPWPRISVWHGGSDRTVSPVNADEIVKQWLDVHGIAPTDTSLNTVDGHPHQVWWGDDGETLVESYTITRMAHGTPLQTGDAFDQCGTEGPFAIEAGISSSYHIASFFGLTGEARATAAPSSSQALAREKSRAQQIVRQVEDVRYTKWAERPRIGAIDIGAIITRALTAAGLMK